MTWHGQRDRVWSTKAALLRPPTSAGSPSCPLAAGLAHISPEQPLRVALAGVSLLVRDVYLEEVARMLMERDARERQQNLIYATAGPKET